jgi:hypothetical protein
VERRRTWEQANSVQAMKHAVEKLRDKRILLFMRQVVNDPRTHTRFALTAHYFQSWPLSIVMLESVQNRIVRELAEDVMVRLFHALPAVEAFFEERASTLLR